MSHSQFHSTNCLYLDMHGLIFETSIWLLAGSTRFLQLQSAIFNQALARGKRPVIKWLLRFLSITSIFKTSFKVKAYAFTKPSHSWGTLGMIKMWSLSVMQAPWQLRNRSNRYFPTSAVKTVKLKMPDSGLWITHTLGEECSDRNRLETWRRWQSPPVSIAFGANSRQKIY